MEFIWALFRALFRPSYGFVTLHMRARLRNLRETNAQSAVKNIADGASGIRLRHQDVSQLHDERSYWSNETRAIRRLNVVSRRSSWRVMRSICGATIAIDTPRHEERACAALNHPA
ncbi:MAG: hypothetical protein ACI8W7_004259 [Gammaproteobacteria bacterium]|jgi:hypothetical protein